MTESLLKQRDAGNRLTPLAPALLGAKLTGDGTEWRGEVIFPTQLGLTLERTQLIVRTHEGDTAFDLPRRVTDVWLGSVYEQHGIEVAEGEVTRHARSINAALKSDASFKRASAIKPRKVTFLWNPRIPLRVATMLGGEGGEGKSVATCDLAATVSTGGTFYGGCRSMGAVPADVLMMSAEDEADTVIRPRLEAAGADLDRVTVRDFDLNTDFVLDDAGFEEIERQVVERRPKLVIIDPVVSFMGDKIDAHRANEVRPMMRKLGALARDYDCAVLVLAHLNKNEGQKGGNRIGGSVDFRNAARSLLLVGGIEGEPERGKALFHDKANYSSEAPPIGYRTVGAGPDGEVARIEWFDTDLTETEVFDSGKRRGPPQGEVVESIIPAVLRGMPNCRADSNVVKNVIRAALPKVQDRTIDRGREKSGVVVRKHPGGHGTDWELSKVAQELLMPLREESAK